MPKRRRVDPDALAALLPPGAAVASHAQLRAIGVPLSTITTRIGPHGPWQRLLPGVVLGHRGTPTRREKRLGAQVYGGETSMITGLDALAEHGVRTAMQLLTSSVHLLIAHASQRTSHGFAVVTRTRELPPPVERRGIRCAPLARALIDACRQLERLDDVRELVADVVQHHGLDEKVLWTEVLRAQRQRTALTRLVLREIGAGVRSAAEAKLREIFARFGVPEPLWNKSLYTPDGRFVASPDAYWPEYGVALELDSMEWHLSAGRYKKTQRRQRRLVVQNVDVIPVAPGDALANPERLCEEVMLKLRNAAGRPLPALVVHDRQAA
ncbi:MAG: hypothetical protein ACLGIV_07485 [Actinomycetes bacterium]